ncbi:YheU family protein [uncultured Desulfobacter sp.]|uniref:YheU family protein n=1 Tax=uncultured Desulfobacter sp. TaxID=240139 RepID=UPI0029F4C04C|nr:YheU family protein [uncultured Desulfobacter sp.]
MKAVKIPCDQLSPEALEGVVEEFVTRDGTDYGEREVPLETKINQVLDQLRTGKAVIVFDSESETCNIFKANDPVLKNIN